MYSHSQFCNLTKGTPKWIPLPKRPKRRYDYFSGPNIVLPKAFWRYEHNGPHTDNMGYIVSCPPKGKKNGISLLMYFYLCSYV